jgi:hypothetical protein
MRNDRHICTPTTLSTILESESPFCHIEGVLKRYLPLVCSLAILVSISLGYFWLLFRAEKFLVHLENKNHLSIYLEKPLADGDWQKLQQRIRSLPLVKKTELINHEETARRFKTQGMTSIAAELLPAFIEVTPTTYEITALEELASQLHRITGFSEIDFGRSELEKLQNWLLLLHYGGRGLGIFLILFAMFVAVHVVTLSTSAQNTKTPRTENSPELVPSLGLSRPPALSLGLEFTFRNPRGERLESSPRAMFKLP